MFFAFQLSKSVMRLLLAASFAGNLFIYMFTSKIFCRVLWSWVTKAACCICWPIANRYAQKQNVQRKNNFALYAKCTVYSFKLGI